MNRSDRKSRPWQALGGIAGPAAFITAWSLLGREKPGYSPVQDPISQLAAADSPTRVLMTAGFVAFGAGVGLHATVLRTMLPGRSAAAAATTAAASVAVAALPLGTAVGGAPHAAAAGVAYASLAATPLLGARAFAGRGQRGAAVVSVATGLAVGSLLAASAFTSGPTGLLQRAGLTIGDVWIATTAVTALVRPRVPRGDT